MMRSRWVVDFGESELGAGLHDNIIKFAQLHGMSQKRLILLGIALYIEKYGNNPQLIQQIGEYLTQPRKKRTVK